MMLVLDYDNYYFHNYSFNTIDFKSFGKIMSCPLKFQRGLVLLQIVPYIFQKSN